MLHGQQEKEPLWTSVPDYGNSSRLHRRKPFVGRFVARMGSKLMCIMMIWIP